LSRELLNRIFLDTQQVSSPVNGKFQLTTGCRLAVEFVSWLTPCRPSPYRAQSPGAATSIKKIRPRNNLRHPGFQALFSGGAAGRQIIDATKDSGTGVSAAPKEGTYRKSLTETRRDKECITPKNTTLRGNASF